MVDFDIKNILLEELGYAGSSTLLPYNPQGIRHPISNVENVYLVRGVPVAYFSRLADTDPARIRELHHSVWNESKAPLLFVVFPTEIRVYNGYAPPPHVTESLD